MPPEPLSTQHLFECDFVSEAAIGAVVDLLLGEASAPQAGWRCTITPNVDHIVRYSRHPHEAEVARRATLVLPDGMPIVWASRLLGRPLRRRLTGSDLFAQLWPELARQHIPTVVLAANDDIASRLQAEHPTATAVVPPVFDASDPAQVGAVVDAIVDACEASGARFVFIGVSMPKTHAIARLMADRWSEIGIRPMVLLLGAAAEFHLGLVPRAPNWMQRAGLEWLFRLAGDPRRLAARYLLDDPRFLLLVWREWAAGRTPPHFSPRRQACSNEPLAE